jgi:hypothetical protein
VRNRVAGGLGAALLVLGMLVVPGPLTPTASAATCTPTGSNGLTAAVVNPAGTVSGPVDATGCDIGVYFNQGSGSVSKADVFGALQFGVLVNGDTTTVSVDIADSTIHHIGDVPFNGNQRGVAVYYRAFLGGSARGKITGNTISQYQKGGIVTNGRGTDVSITGNTVTGLGPVAFIAQNGIQVGYGADASVMRNTVSANSYTGTSTVSGGIVVVGGPGYGACPDGAPCAYTVGTQIVGNTVTNNDIGIFLTNIDAAGNAPSTATNVHAVNNTVTNNALTNNYGGVGYQAGISDVGNNDKIINNKVSGNGYDPAANPTAYTVKIDADVSFTNRPKVHANK